MISNRHELRGIPAPGPDLRVEGSIEREAFQRGNRLSDGKATIGQVENDDDLKRNSDAMGLEPDGN